MEKTKNHTNHSYSQDYILVTAFQQEIGHLMARKDSSNIEPIVEEYLRKRVKELKERWK